MNRLVRHDASLSVARAFERRDWERLLAAAGLAPCADHGRRLLPVPFRGRADQAGMTDQRRSAGDRRRPGRRGGGGEARRSGARGDPLRAPGGGAPAGLRRVRERERGRGAAGPRPGARDARRCRDPAHPGGRAADGARRPVCRFAPTASRAPGSTRACWSSPPRAARSVRRGAGVRRSDAGRREGLAGRAQRWPPDRRAGRSSWRAASTRSGATSAAAIARRAGSASSCTGGCTPIRQAALGDGIELFLDPSGYAGLQRIGSGIVNLCLDDQRRELPGAGGILRGHARVTCAGGSRRSTSGCAARRRSGRSP